jgi:cysteine desulfurase / selenocysteine lyase
MTLFDPADFAIPPGITHVCAGGETAPLRRHDAVLSRYLRDKSSGMAGRVAQETEIARARAGAAALWGVDIGSIGFVSNVAEGVSMIAESLDWRDGDNIVIDADEYPSVAGPFLARVALKQARGNEPDRFAAVVDDRTRVIGVSYVSYLTGERHDLHALRALADKVGALLVVDFTQASGYLPIHAEVADFAFSACYKWMLGITGVAIAYWNRRRQPSWAPASAGWHSFEPGHRGYDNPPPLRADAMRFTRGNPAHAPVYVLAEALDYLAGHDMAAVLAHVQTLTVAMLERLHALQLPTLTPSDPARHGASVCVPSSHAQAIVDGMAQNGVLAWNGQGRVRFSFHGYNSRRDVDRAIDALRAEWR